MLWAGVKEMTILKLVKTHHILALVMGIFTFPAALYASISFTQNFDNINEYSSSTLVWNLSTQSLHPPLKVNNYFEGSFQDLNFDIGTAKHGVFNSSTYTDWDTDGNSSNQVIRINTDTYPVLEFQSFNLESGWTLQPEGSKPLIIRVQGNVVINGTIDCSGENGDSVTSDQTQVAQGGTARCGGGSGGRGGTDDGVSPVLPQAGTQGGSSVSGGSPGTQQAVVDGGDGAGGGGGYSQNLTDADNGVRPPASTGGAKGTNFEDNAFQETGGGSGGGGGFYYTGSDTANRSRGGGGGAGGGVIYIYSGGDITLSSSAKITANGGAGGGGNLKAGGGGGGAGGSILIFAGGEITLNTAEVVALGGAGGSTLGGNGGDGATGRTWITDGTGGDGPTGSGDNPVSLLAAIGSVNYQTGNFEAESVTIDSYNSFPEFVSVETTGTVQTGDQVLFDLSSNKSNNFVANWSESSTVVGQKLDRYFKYRIRMSSNNENSPSILESAKFNFNAYVLTDFDMATGCGSLNQGSGVLWFLILLPFLVLIIIKLNLQSYKSSH